MPGPLRHLRRATLLLAGLAAPLGAQGPTVVPPAPSEDSTSDSTASAPAATIAPATAFLASAVAPGGGQWLTGSRRWLLYAAVEVGAAAFLLDRRRDGHALRRAYRDLAWSVARSGTDAPRRDGDFEYFEAIANYDASGAFDADAERPGVQPETDESTYNGMVWSLARGMFAPPDTDSLSTDAVRYYTRHAVPEDMVWSWSGRMDARQRYRDLIDRSDDALRTASRLVGLVLANHVISAVDAFVTARLLGTDDAGPNVGLRTGMRPTPGGLRWSTAVHFMPNRKE